MSRASVRPDGDDVKSEAGLVMARKVLRRPVIAAAFGWTLEQVKATADALAGRLGGTGLMLQIDPRGRYAIRPRLEVLSATEVGGLRRRQLAQAGVDFWPFACSNRLHRVGCPSSSRRASATPAWRWGRCSRCG